MSSFRIHPSGYGVKHLSELTGLSPHVLRKWEQRYDLLAPQRAENGYRVYDAEELQLLFFLKCRLTAGLSIGRLARQGRAALLAEMNAGPVDVPHVPRDSQPQARELIQAARRSDQAAVNRTIALLIHQWGVGRALTDVFFPVLHAIGELWHQGRISITGEHAVSQTIQQLLVHSNQLQNGTNRPQAVIACVSNDFHEIGAMSAARFLRDNGWNATYLGPNVDADVVRLACHRRQAKLSLLSCVIELSSDDMDRLIGNIVRRVLPLTTVVMGGRGAGSYRDRLERNCIRYISDIERVKALTPRSLEHSGTASQRVRQPSSQKER